MRVKFFKPYITGNEIKYIKKIIDNNSVISGDGEYTKKVHKFLQKRYKVSKVLLTTSGTTALEMAIRLLNLKPDDEIIAPSFTFSSTVNAILMVHGLRVKFAEIQGGTLNIDPEDIKRKITNKTKAIIVVHYAGVACDMDKIMNIAKARGLKIIEDAAQAFESQYKGKYLGTIGNYGCFSFHETKNIVCGEGGAIFINSNNKKDFEKAEIIREKGTNRSKFFRREINKYEWVDIGSSCLPSDILAAFLLAQLESIDKIQKLRFQVYNYYRNKLLSFQRKGVVKLPLIPSYAKHNAHMFYILFDSETKRDYIMGQMRKVGIDAFFHYIPLHSSPQGRSLGYKKNDLPLTENVSKRLLRLPIYAGLKKKEYEYVISNLTKFLTYLDKNNV